MQDVQNRFWKRQNVWSGQGFVESLKFKSPEFPGSLRRCWVHHYKWCLVCMCLYGNRTFIVETILLGLGGEHLTGGISILLTVYGLVRISNWTIFRFMAQCLHVFSKEISKSKALWDWQKRKKVNWSSFLLFHDRRLFVCFQVFSCRQFAMVKRGKEETEKEKSI